MKKILVVFVAMCFGLTVNASSSLDSLKSHTSFRWEAISGLFTGLTFDADSVTTYYFKGSLHYPITFNAKVWKNGSPIPWLAIVKISSLDGIVTDKNFRFDQATGQRKQKFFLLNKTEKTIYVRLGNEEIMLMPGKKSRVLEAYQGWYVVEASYLDGTRVVPKDIIIGVAYKQRMVEIKKIK